ncbi:hypothetical protein A9976_05405 [Delftia sp. UME58]|nr:hypothetical protein [Delftia sp. UME58]
MRVTVFIGAAMGVIFLLAAFFVSGAPQEAALAGMACASAIIPYVLFRLQSVAVEQRQRQEIIDLLKQGHGPMHGAVPGHDAPQDQGTGGLATPRTWMS